MPTKDARILIVEDESIVARDVQLVLTNLGYTVLAVASSGKAAIRKTAELRPDLVLMDIMLQGELDGIQAAQQIHTLYDVPIIFLTAYADEKILQRAKITEPFGYILKPFEEKELYTNIEMALYKHRMERKLRESEERHRSLIENISDVIMILEQDGIIRYQSPSFEQTGGYKPKELTGKSIFNLIHPQDVSHTADALAHSAQNPNHSFSMQLRLRHKDGSWHIYEAIGTNLLDNPILAGIVINCRDVTRRKLIEETLQQRNRELALLNEANQALSATLDQDQVLLTFLEEVGRLLNVTSISVWLIERETNKLVCRQASGPGSDAGALRGRRLAPGEGIVGRVIASGESLFVPDINSPLQHHISGPIESIKRFNQRTGLAIRSVLSVPLRVKPEIIGALQIVDTAANRFKATDLVLLESLSTTAAIAIEHARLYERARQDAETKTSLLREVNHRVKNNLSAIIGILYAEQQHAKIKDRAIYRSIMQDLARRVQGLSIVHSLLSTSEWRPLRLSDLIVQVSRSSLEALPPGKYVSLDVPLSPIRVTSDQAHYLALMVNELVTNAVKHTLHEQDTTQIHVHISLVEDMVQIEFRDNGPGYPQDVLSLERHSVGFDLVQSIVRDGLRGDLNLRNDHGAITLIRFKAQAAPNQTTPKGKYE
jgi:PAS domain S-box-containing protein